MTANVKANHILRQVVMILWFMSRYQNKDILNKVIFAFKMS